MNVTAYILTLFDKLLWLANSSIDPRAPENINVSCNKRIYPNIIVYGVRYYNIFWYSLL